MQHVMARWQAMVSSVIFFLGRGHVAGVSGVGSRPNENKAAQFFLIDVCTFGSCYVVLRSVLSLSYRITSNHTTVSQVLVDFGAFRWAVVVA